MTVVLFFLLFGALNWPVVWRRYPVFGHVYDRVKNSSWNMQNEVQQSYYTAHCTFCREQFFWRCENSEKRENDTKIRTIRARTEEEALGVSGWLRVHSRKNRKHTISVACNLKYMIREFYIKLETFSLWCYKYTNNTASGANHAFIRDCCSLALI